MVKLTKRKGFNFFRSYYDVYNELERMEDKVAFIDALFDRQFLGVKPTDLKGMAKFAYISQTNSIDSQVKGYEDKTGTKLLNPTEPPTEGVGKTILTPTAQVQEEEQVQDVNKYSEQQFLKRWKDARLHFDKKPTNISKLQSFERINFDNIKKTYSGVQIEQAIQGMFQQETFPKTRLRPSHFLELEHFETYLTCFDTKEVLFKKANFKRVDRL